MTRHMQDVDNTNNGRRSTYGVRNILLVYVTLHLWHSLCVRRRHRKM